MQAAARPYAMAGTALAAASLLAVTPIAQRLPDVHSVTAAVRLVDTFNPLDVPVNLFYDILNIPYNEVQALDADAESLFFSGTWAVTSSTNIWGIDPGDPGHFQAGTDLLFPFPALSGMTGDINAGNYDFFGNEYDWNAGLGQQLTGLVAAEAPVNAFCAAEGCTPIAATSPITGGQPIDSLLWWEGILTGLQKFPLINNWFQVPLSQLFNGYDFNQNLGLPEPGYDGADPSGVAYSFPSGAFRAPRGRIT